MLVGFIDDQFGLPPLFRLFVQTLSALLLVAVGVRFEAAFGTPWTPPWDSSSPGFGSWASPMPSTSWTAWTASPGIAFISAMSLLFVSAQFPYWAAGTLVLSALAGASLGFLRHNLHPSRIILGDAGAYFLGYTLAATALLGNLKLTTFLGLLPRRSSSSSPSWTPPRWWCGGSSGAEPLSTPGKDHIHHRLLARGFPKGGWPSSSGGGPPLQPPRHGLPGNALGGHPDEPSRHRPGPRLGHLPEA